MPNLENLIFIEPGLLYGTLKCGVTHIFNLATDIGNSHYPIHIINNGTWMCLSEYTRDCLVITAKQLWYIDVGLDHTYTITDDTRRDLITQVLEVKKIKHIADFQKLSDAYDDMYRIHQEYRNFANSNVPDLPRPTRSSEILRQCDLIRGPWNLIKCSAALR